MPETEQELSPERMAKIKEKILEQLKNLPPEKANELKEQIESMPDDEFVDFLKRNRMIQQDGENAESQCIFCLIAQEKVESSKIYEDSEIIAVLDINPISKGHVLAIPKEHISETQNLKASMFEKARMLASLVKKELDANSIELLTSSRLGHAVINIIPIYNGAPLLDFKRQKISNDDIKGIAEKLSTSLKNNEQVEEEEKIKKQKAAVSEEVKNIRIKRRIP